MPAQAGADEPRRADGSARSRAGEIDPVKRVLERERRTQVSGNALLRDGLKRGESGKDELR